MRASTNVEDVGTLKPRNSEMSTFAGSLIENPAKTVEDNGLFATVDGVEGGIDGAEGEAEADGCFGDICEESDGLLATSHGGRKSQILRREKMGKKQKKKMAVGFKGVVGWG